MEAGPRDTDQRDTEQDAPDTRHEAGRLSPDGPDENDVTPEVEVELRPAGRLRIWQLAPIVMLAAVDFGERQGLQVQDAQGLEVLQRPKD